MSFSARVPQPRTAVVAFAALLAWTAAPLSAPRGPKPLTRETVLQCRLLADPHVHRSYVPARAARASLTAQPAVERSSVLAVTYTGFTPEAQAAFQFAVDIWGSQLASPVPITVDAQFADLGSGILGTETTRFFEQNVPGGIPGTFYSAALANRLAGTDMQPATPDVAARFNSSVNWYYGTDGNVPNGSYDFVSAVLHELGHGLGFFGSGWMTVGGRGMWGLGTPTAIPSIYDRFVVNGSGQGFIDTAVFANPSAALAAQITSNNLFFNGAFTRAANGNAPAPLYAPRAWAAVSSYSHLNEATYTVGNQNSLMTPLLASGEAIHDPGPVVHGMFRDMGWLVAGNACAYTLSPTPASLPTSGGTGSLTIGTGAGCGWAATSDASWLTLGSPVAAAGPTTISFTVSANTSSVARVATIRAGGQSVTVTQAGVVCAFTMSNLVTFGAPGGSTPFSVTASAPDCPFTTSSAAPWLTISGTQTGSTTLTLRATAAGATTRAATITVAGTTVAPWVSVTATAWRVHFQPGLSATRNAAGR